MGYESDLRKAMEYVFGSTLVCDTLDNAKKVAFDKQVRTKTVTLGGDIFDPQGTLSGGKSMEWGFATVYSIWNDNNIRIISDIDNY